MKKPSFKIFSQQGIKDFFFRHSEKLFFALSVGLIALFFWLGLKTPEYSDTTPADMLQTSQRANDYIHDANSWNKMAEHRVPLTDAADQIETAQPVDSNRYPLRTMLGPVLKTLEKRTDPAFLIPGDLVTRYFRSQVMLRGDQKRPSRASNLDKLPNSVLTYPENQQGESFIYRVDSPGASYVTVDAVVGMALIDYEAQLQAYRDTFQYQRGYDPNRDVPQFAFIEVQRKTADSDWKPITATLFENYDKMGPPAEDVVTDDLRIPNVTMDVPPLLGMDYREFATLPEMKAVTIEEYLRKKEEEKKKEEQEEADAEAPDDADIFGGEGKSEDEEDKEDESDDEEEEIVKYRLIRFFDLDNKKPGVEYFYRVRLWFQDPNNPDAVSLEVKDASKGPGRSTGGGSMGTDGDMGGGDDKDDKKKKKDVKPLYKDDLSAEVRRRLLAPVPDVEGLPKFGEKNTEEAQEAFLRTVLPGEWVESKSAVTATRGFETFVAGPVAAPSPNYVGDQAFYETEPKVTVVVNSFQDDLGVFVPAQVVATPGSLLNFRKVTNLLHPITLQIKEVFESVTRSRRGEQKTGRMFETDAVLVDAMGGERQPFSRRPDTFYAPAEILIMDRNGRLILRNDLEDETAFRHANFVSKKNAAAIEEANSKDDSDDDDDDDGY